MAESPTKKRKDAAMSAGNAGADPFARYPHQYGHGQPPSYNSHPQAPPYGYHAPPPHYGQGMYANAPHPPSHQPGPGQSSSLYASPSQPQPWMSSAPPSAQSQPYFQPNQPPASSPRGNWNGSAQLSSEASASGTNSSTPGGSGTRYSSNGGNSTQPQSSPTEKSGDSKSSPSGAGAWHQNGWSGAQQGQYMQHHPPPPPHMWGTSSGSPPSWNRGNSSGALLCSPTNSLRQTISHQSSSGGTRKDKEDKDKGRGSYRCGKCGVPKKGHICPYQPKFRRRPDEPAPDMRNASTQVEMDEFLVLRRLNLEIQGFPESYISEPLGDVGAEAHPPIVSNSPHQSVPPSSMGRNTMLGAVPPGMPSSSGQHLMDPGTLIDTSKQPISNGALGMNDMNNSFPSTSSAKSPTGEGMSDRGTSPMRQM